MKRDVPQHTRRQQARAADPGLSAWVSANAGSGKTHVLAQRVVRLLLDGVAPSRLICLTFTRAAAANMSERVFRTLGRWTLLDDAALLEAIAETGAARPRDLDAARALFARALETPGGLKIQTIHAFCERLLHLFPFEANAPAGFRVVEEGERAEWLAAARAGALDEAARTDPAALAILARETGEEKFQETIGAALKELDEVAEPARQEENLRRALALEPGEDETTIANEIVEGGLGWRAWAELAEFFDAGSSNDRTAAASLRRAAALAPGAACLEHYLKVFLNGDGDPRKAIFTGALPKLNAGLCERISAEGARVLALHEKMKAARAFARTRALLSLAHVVRDRYARTKRDRSALDYDDLIVRARNLLRRSGAAAWALYKLDGGVDHILVDEAQDTSLAQWEILQSLAEEFTAGAGAVARPRSFFAVGDEKQSIFSFQGAAPAAFADMKREFQKRIEAAGQTFAHVQLDLSFRSAPEVLRAVDLVFAREEARRGLVAPGETAPGHVALKSDVRGLVELWPPILKTKEPDASEWALPVDQPRASDPASELARRIADSIATLLATGSRERVAGEAPGALRAVAPGDIMILVRRRDAFFDQMVRALKDAGVPVAGADRLDVGGHIAAMDLVAAIRATLAPEDDLTLACVLKSPLIGLDDDDLIALAPRRKASLWRALRGSADPRHAAAARRIEAWIEHARGARPFEFLGRILGAEGGRKAFLARLGPEAADAIDELLNLALAHEREQPPSLPAFAHAIEALDLSVRRDMEAAGALVRVMTAHAAKGLEARIVFLPDTCATPSATHGPTLFRIGAAAAPALVWSPRKGEDPPAVADARARATAAADDEYRRLLYVAMTRAEERLYIAGHCGEKGPQVGSWHGLVAAGLADCATPEPADFDPAQTVLRLGAPSRADDAVAPRARAPRVDLPDWALRPAPLERDPAPPVRPSSALSAADARAEPQDDAGAAGARGALVHRLLQSLADIAPERRAAAAQAFLQRAAPGVAEPEAIVVECLAVLDAPALAPFFGPRSRAEAALAARVARADRPPVDIVGRLDRLVERDREIWIADFKTGAPALRPAHVAQMALYRAGLAQIYPGRAVRAFLVYTRTARAQELTAAQMDAALAAL